MSKTFGRVRYIPAGDCWVIDPIEPHAIIRMKSIFRKIDKTKTSPFVFPNSPEVCHELEWFFQRYPLDITPEDEKALLGQKSLHLINLSELERLMKSDYVPREFKINGEPRHYQSVATELYLRNKILLVGDDVGLGKSLIGILSFLDPKTLPALVVVQTHLPPQWKAMIEKFVPGIKVHLIKGTRPYPLPPADVYIMKYSCLAGWSDVYGTGVFKSVVFDEVQELRISGSNKYRGAQNAVKAVEYVLGLSATPIYNFGDEIYAILNLMKQGCLGGWGEFTREWCTNYGQHWKVDEPQALGTHLREQFLFLRRTRADVNREMPIVNKIVHTVEFDEGAVKGIEDLARKLAIRVTTGSFVERGQAARELDIMVRHATGVSKAKYVAEYVKILLSNGEPVLLAGWHRDCFIAGTPVLMYDGTIKTVENISVGDEVMGPDSQPRKVLNLARGHGKTFKITPKKGASWTCSGGHVLSLRRSDRKGSAPVEMTAREFSLLSDRTKRKHVLYRSECIEFDTSSTPTEPWLLGYWLGNGASALNDFRISTAEPEVVSECERIASKYGLSLTKFLCKGGTTPCCIYSFSTKTYRGRKDRHKLLNLFRDLNLRNNKHVPQLYKSASTETRWELLAGLIDSDGTGGACPGQVSFSNVNERLANDVAFLARSLGLAAYVHPKEKSKSGYYRNNSAHFVVDIHGDVDNIPLRVPRKRSEKRKINKNPLHVGLKIEDTGVGEFFGFEVDGDNLFLLGDFTVVHNCYDIWLKEFKEYHDDVVMKTGKPAPHLKAVMYTGSESPAEKEKAKQAFINGEAGLMIISLRSGIGLDGLQARCNVVVFGELDWSPAVHHQVTGRVDRDGQQQPVTAIYLVSNSGSDPLIVDLLGLKASQAQGIIDPLATVQATHSDESRITLLAQKYLAGRST